MGLIKELVLLPVAPVRGTLWVAERISDQVEQERYSSGAAVQQLDHLEEAKERGELDEQEAAERQEQVIEEQLVRTDGGER
jgi:Gas vesicle protein G